MIRMGAGGAGQWPQAAWDDVYDYNAKKQIGTARGVPG